jgi:hypothetical protein
MIGENFYGHTSLIIGKICSAFAIFTMREGAGLAGLDI